MKLIKLTKGYCSKVDDEDYKVLSKYKWCVGDTGKGRYYAMRYEKGIGMVRMHRVITNCPKGLTVDHINGDTLDNQKKNLRVCSQAENNLNTKISIRNTSGFKGVCKRARKTVPPVFQAYVVLKKKFIIIGLFDTAEKAYEARKSFVKPIHGDFYHD